MKYLIGILALLVVGCGNRKQPPYSQSYVDSLRQTYQQAMDSVNVRHRHVLDSMNRQLNGFKMRALEAEARHPFIRENRMDTLVRIRYKNKINGYRVSVLWQPEGIGFRGIILGSAIITFKKEDVQFSIVHSHFFLNSPLGYARNHDESDAWGLKFNRSSVYEIEYHEDKNTYLQPDLPFFFVENGQKLVLTIWAEGGRDANLYRFYKKENSWFHCYALIPDEPFVSEINDYAKITDEEIRTSFGSMVDVQKVYRKKTDSYPEYELERIEEYDQFKDSVYTYKVEPEPRLIKKEAIKR